MKIIGYTRINKETLRVYTSPGIRGTYRELTKREKDKLPFAKGISFFPNETELPFLIIVKDLTNEN